MPGPVFLFPGQGSHYVGMGKGLYDAKASVRRLFEEASDIVGTDLRPLCFEGPEALLTRTDNVQPAITLVSIAALESLREEGLAPHAAAGHSLGEYAALCAAGVLSFGDTMRLVQVRGAAMQDAAERRPGAMAAILGLEAEVVRSVCDEVGTDSVQIANHNAPGQLVVTGASDAVAHAAKLAKARGATLVVPLRVSGPWHSSSMRPAQEPLRRALDTCALWPPRMEVVANLTGAAYGADVEEIKQALVDQLVSPVLWTQSINGLIDRGHRTFVEVGPGRVLAGLMKGVRRDLTIMNVHDPETLSQLILHEHSR